MEESFTLPVLHKGEETLVDFTFRRLGYTYKISAYIGGQEIFFEPDEEGSFRATLVDPNGRQEQEKIDRAYIQAMIQKLTEEFK